jgi:hypothetical protein
MVIPPEVTAWVNAVVADGGSVSTATQNAMIAFVNGCMADGIWSKISSGLILPFASDGFSGAFTPLVIPTGKTITNNNFVSGDYSLTTGLNCGTSNSSKRLSTNLIVSDLFTATSCQMSVYTRQLFTNTNVTIYCGSGNASSYAALYKNFNGDDYFDTFNNSTSGGRVIVSTASTRGLLTGSRTSATSSVIYRNGSSAGSINTSGGTFPSSGPISIFAFFNGSSYTVFDRQIHSYIYMGPALTASEEASHYSRVQALQTALGRQV